MLGGLDRIVASKNSVIVNIFNYIKITQMNVIISYFIKL